MLPLWICLGLFLAWWAAVLASNLLSYPRLLEALRSGAMTRTRLYQRMMAGLWAPALLAALALALGVFSPRDMGLLVRDFGCPAWLRITLIAVAGLWFLFLLAQNISLHHGYRKGKQDQHNIPDRLRPMLPETSRERRLWAAAAVTAGLCEELLFRGFLLHALTALFPALTVAGALAVATLLFGAGHLYQGPKEAAKPLVIGLMLGAFYLAFGSIWPGVVLHVMQDLEAAWVLCP